MENDGPPSSLPTRPVTHHHSIMYAPKCLVIVSRLDYIETFRVRRVRRRFISSARIAVIHFCNFRIVWELFTRFTSKICRYRWTRWSATYWVVFKCRQQVVRKFDSASVPAIGRRCSRRNQRRFRLRTAPFIYYSKNSVGVVISRYYR